MTQGPDQKKPLVHDAQSPVASTTFRRSGRPPDDAAMELEALKALSEQHGVPGIDLSQICIRTSDLDILPREIAERHAILPVLMRDDRVFVAMVSPGDKNVIDELEFVTGKRVYPYVAIPSALRVALDAAYDAKFHGELFYSGPRCSREMLERMGALSTTVAGPSTIPDVKADEAPVVVVDDASSRVAQHSEMNDSDFGNTSQDLSIVAALPDNLDPSPESQVRGSGRTILVVDDEPDIRKMLTRLLQDRSYQVIEAERGLQALRVVKEKMPDLIILDAMLPEIHGFEIARRLKGSKKYGHIPIIMISAVYRGWRYAEDVKTSYGVDAYIEKPFRISALLKAIDEVTSRALATKSAAVEGDTNPAAEAEAALAAGVAAYQAGDVDGAMAHLSRGIGIDPLACRLHFHLALLCGKKGLVFEAIQHLERALEINPRHFPGLKNLAVLYQKAGFRNKATETWERAIVVAPDEPTRQSIKELLLGML